MQNRVSIQGFDQDVVNVSGNTFAHFVDTNSRFIGGWRITLGANGDKNKWTRYFAKGGLYKIRIIYLTLNSAGKLDIGLDSSTNNIFSQIDEYTSGVVYNVIKETVLEISRGYHDITSTVNGKNASSSGYDSYMNILEFDLIQEYPVYQDDQSPTPLPIKMITPSQGLDNRSGLTTVDGAAIVLCKVPGRTNTLYRITADIYATLFTSGTATYTITWTENGQTKTLVVTATALNVLGTATDLINPDSGTNITAQLTGTFTATVKVAGLVEQFA